MFAFGSFAPPFRRGGSGRSDWRGLGSFTKGVGDAHKPIELEAGHKGGDEGFLDFGVDVSVRELEKRDELG